MPVTLGLVTLEDQLVYNWNSIEDLSRKHLLGNFLYKTFLSCFDSNTLLYNVAEQLHLLQVQSVLGSHDDE